jgi:hypothetical protein
MSAKMKIDNRITQEQKRGEQEQRFGLETKNPLNCVCMCA